MSVTLTCANDHELRVGDVIDISHMVVSRQAPFGRQRAIITSVTPTTMTIVAMPLPWWERIYVVAVLLYVWLSWTVRTWNPCNDEAH
jgi:hypothetical protein